MKLTAICILLSACVNLPHLDPAPRSPNAVDSTTVLVESACADDYTDWWSKAGTGVAISERHILTAAHVVSCPALPGVLVTFPSGRKMNMVVERDAAMFEDGSDVARLEIFSAENFNLGIVPPCLAAPVENEALTAHLRDGRTATGTYLGSNVIQYMATSHGDSGSGVWNIAGCLVGLVSKGTEDHSYTRIVPVGKTWLSGT